MARGRMFLDQRRMQHVILYTIAIDVALGYVFKKYQGPHTVLPLALLYLLNIVVLVAVYRFWKVPVFEWDEAGFIIYSLSPFKKDSCAWEHTEYVCFKQMEEKKGRTREYLIIHYVKDGLHKTNMLPMDMVGFKDRLKEEFEELMKKKGIPPMCQPGL